MKLSIPMPPGRVLETHGVVFVPAPELSVWVYDTFISDGELQNPDHEHLSDAEIGFLWTNADYKSKMRTIVGTAEQPKSGNKWSAQRKDFQLMQWFGDIPDFVITLQAHYFASVGNPERCALIEHELYHCAQSIDQYGLPRFSKQTGKPIYTVRGHDVEEFVGVVRRYGAEASGVDELVRVANQGPEIARAEVDGICGLCSKQVA